MLNSAMIAPTRSQASPSGQRPLVVRSSFVVRLGRRGRRAARLLVLFTGLPAAFRASAACGSSRQSVTPPAGPAKRLVAAGATPTIQRSLVAPDGLLTRYPALRPPAHAAPVGSYGRPPTPVVARIRRLQLSVRGGEPSAVSRQPPVPPRSHRPPPPHIAAPISSAM